MSEDNIVNPPTDLPLTPPATSSAPPPPPVPTYVVPPRKSSPLPLLLGFFLVIIIASVLGVAYYTAKFRSTVTPTPSLMPSLAPSPSPEVSATPSATPKSSLKPTTKPIVSPLPTATPFSLPNLDLRFGNPSANVKQTIDDGSGAGRVINREYSSIQAGQFDEVSSAWSPKVTVCFHLTASEAVLGKLIKFTMMLDDKTEVEDNMSWIDKLEAGRIYDWCHDVPSALGKHTAKLTINGDKSLKEYSYANDLASVAWENLPDNIAPNYSLTGPFDWGTNGTCLVTAYVSDNVTAVADLKVEEQIDGGAWVTSTGADYCFQGTSGTSHSYGRRITDLRGNKNEQAKTFVLY